MTTATVQLWGRDIGAVSWDEERAYSFFEYETKFARTNIQLAPMKMPLSKTIYSFPALSRDTFHRLPGLLADSLPDKFGTAVINAWLAQKGRPQDSVWRQVFLPVATV